MVPTALPIRQPVITCRYACQRLRRKMRSRRAIICQSAALAFSPQVIERRRRNRCEVEPQAHHAAGVTHGAGMKRNLRSRAGKYAAFRARTEAKETLAF